MMLPLGAPVGFVDHPSFLIEVLNAAKLRRKSPSRKPSMSDVVCGPRNGNRGRGASANDCLIGWSIRYLPTAPLLFAASDRKRSIGFSMPFAASTTILAVAYCSSD